MFMQHLEDILRFFGANMGDPASWQSMIERSHQIIWASIYIALLAVVLYHALNGLRNVILELTPSARTERVVTRTIIAFGIIIFVWASYVPIALLSR
jgi:succinate dehydrogenase hydrophobic anchor subunit